MDNIKVVYPRTTTWPLAQTHYEAFWRLCQETYLAKEKKSFAPSGPVGSIFFGRESAFSFIHRAAVSHGTDECLTIARQMRANMEKTDPVKETNRDEFATDELWRNAVIGLSSYRDAYIHACDEIIHIIQGGQ